MFNLCRNLLLLAFLLGFTQVHAQDDSRQLISSHTKKFRIHFGVEGGLGANLMTRHLEKFAGVFDESEIRRDRQILIAPRPSASLGIFSEMEFDCGFGMRTYLGYLANMLPKPVENLSTGNPAKYNIGYMHTLDFTWMFYYQPKKSRVRFGLGFTSLGGFQTEAQQTGDDALYWETVSSFVGLRAEVGYQVNPRMHINTYALMGHYNGTITGAAVDNVGAGVSVSYRIKGKEYEIKRDVYRVNYEADQLPKKPKNKVTPY